VLFCHLRIGIFFSNTIVDHDGRYAQLAAEVTPVVHEALPPVVVGFAPYIIGGVLIATSLVLVPAIILTGKLDIENRRERYEAAAAEGHAKYLAGEQLKVYVGTPSAASEKLRAKLLGETKPTKGRDLAVATREKVDKNNAVATREKVDKKGIILVYATYWKADTETGKIYIGRTRGEGPSDMNPKEIARIAVAKRDSAHDEKTGEGYGKAQLDEYTVATLPLYIRWMDPAYQAIRGREQQGIDLQGGAQSDNLRSDSANKIRGVKKDHILGMEFHKQANVQFGNLFEYTGDKPRR
jgi:hypothetical protein